MAPPPSFAARSAHHRRPSSSPLSGGSMSSPPCNHSPAATLDLLIMIVVLCSCAFLLASSFSYIFSSICLLLSPSIPTISPVAAVIVLLICASIYIFSILFLKWTSWIPWSRRCGNPRCRGLKKAMEFDVQLQTEESIKAGGADAAATAWKEIDALPWKGGQGGNNPDYECLRQELGRMAPPNGRAVLLFRAKCGCPVTKLEAWAPKRGRRHKKGSATLAIEGGLR